MNREWTFESAGDALEQVYNNVTDLQDELKRLTMEYQQRFLRDENGRLRTPVNREIADGMARQTKECSKNARKVYKDLQEVSTAITALRIAQDRSSVRVDKVDLFKRRMQEEYRKRKGLRT